MRPLAIVVLVMACAATALTSAVGTADAQTSTEIPSIHITPDKVDSRIGTLEFKDGAPSAETVDRVYDTFGMTLKWV
jgi:hypothetical protein